jgi:hypothetical protein
MSSITTFCSPAVRGAELRAVPTFENCSIYVEQSSSIPDQLRVRYRQRGSLNWLDAHRLVASSNDPVPRGSLFSLLPGTAYEVQCLDAAGKLVAESAFETWREDVPIGRTIQLAELAPAGGPIRISQGGTPDAWIRYVGDDSYVVEGGDRENAAVLVDGVNYVILENFVVRGGRRHGVHVLKSHHVWIRNGDIAGFGRLGKQDLAKDGKYYDEQGRAINYDAGVCVERSAQTIVERCYIHDPRNHANSWFYSHPAGPNGIYLNNVLGELVIRYNDMVGSDQHRWNDVIEASGNGNVEGGFNRDSDIYGNYLAFCNDDSIELDGGQCNVRFYGNKCEGALCGISTAANRKGPSYVIGNVVANLADERRVGSAGTKNGGGSTYSQGTTFFYHNTFFGKGSGIAAVGFGEDRNRGMFLGVSRNNIFAVTGSGIRDPYAPPGCDYDYDLFARPWGGPGAFEVGRTVEPRGLVQDAGFIDPAGADFRLKPVSLARGAGQRIDGLQVFQPGEHVDLGALPSSVPGAMVPWRPLPIRALPYQVDFRGSLDEMLARRATVIVEAGTLREPLPFTIAMNQVTDWLRVEPASGVLKSGERLALQVSLTPAISAQEKRAVGAFLVRLANGIGIPVTVYADVRAKDIRQLAEAESLPGAEAFKSGTDISASGGRFIEFPSTSDRAAGLTMEVDVPATGWYSPAGQHDSVFLSVDDGKPRQVSLDVSGQDWHWATYGDSTGTLIHLENGRRRLLFRPRESMSLDAIQLRGTELSIVERGL